jgi:hypothetical protein
MTQKAGVGFSQRIRLEWLQYTAELFLARQTRDQTQTALQEFLQDQLSVGGTAERGNREKAITILLKIWVSVPKHLEALRNDGLELLQRLPSHDHLAVHWGMTIAVYPFFGIVAETVGRLLRLQGTAASSQVQRRVREKLGERETVARAARRVLRCFVDWGVLQEAGEKGVYWTAPPHLVEDSQLAAWLIEAVLIANGARAMPLHTLAQSPALFPFSLGPAHVIAVEVRNRLGVFRQGLDEDMVTLQNGGAARY